MKICEKCNEVNEDGVSVCKNCLNSSFIDYDNYIKEENLKINNKLKMKRKIQIISTILYFVLSILLFIISSNIKPLDMVTLFLGGFTVILSFLLIVFTEEMCKLRLMFYVDINMSNIHISDFNIIITKLSGIISYLLFIYLLFFEK